MPGNEQHDATARCNSTPLTESQIAGWPVSMPNEAHRNDSAQCAPFRNPNQATYSSSGTSSLPPLASISARSRDPADAWLDNQGQASLAGETTSAKVRPEVSCAPTTDPADGPTTRSAPPNVPPPSTTPSRSPAAQPIPSGPPPPRTSTLDIAPA